MSTDKSDYVRFELRFEKNFSDRLDAWIKENKSGAFKSVVVRQVLEEAMQNDPRETLVLSGEARALTDRIRSQSIAPVRRMDVIEEALKNYIEKHKIP